MVRRGPDRRLLRSCRRGKRRRLVSAARWLGLDHRQGRRHFRPARRRDYRENQPGRPASCSIASPTNSACPSTSASTRAASVAQKNLLKALSPERLAMKELAGEPVQATLNRRTRQRPILRRHQGDHGKRLVRSKALRNRGCLQDLCGKFQEPAAPAGDSTTGAGSDHGGGLRRPRSLGSLHRLLISPPRGRQSEFPLEGPTERLLGFVADRIGQLGNRFLVLAQVQLRGLKSPEGQVSDRRHAHQPCEALHECAARHRDFLRERLCRPGRTDAAMYEGQGSPDPWIF